MGIGYNAFHWFDGLTQNRIGYLYSNGVIVKKDENKAFEWFQRSASKGNLKGITNLGACYMIGLGVDIDQEKAFNIFHSAAKKKYSQAAYYLGICYYNGIGTKRDLDEAEKWLFESSSADAQILLNQINPEKYPTQTKKGKNKTELYSAELVKKAEAGDASAQCSLGSCFWWGKGVTQDYKEAVKWYTKSAEQGNATAQGSLGVCYYMGYGVTKDYNEAVKWVAKAADQGNADGQCLLGWNYANGEGVTQDYKEAVKWYTKAARQGNAWAQNELGTYYEYGKGVTQDYKEAVKWYTKAAEQGNAIAQTNLGWCCHEGKGVTQDYKEAVKWLTKAAEQGNANGQNSLGWCYYEGKGVTQDYKEAVKLFTKAAEQGVSRAQNNLGDCYMSGKGVTKDSKEAMKWYTRASEKGDSNAKQELPMLAVSGSAKNSPTFSLELVSKAEQGDAVAQRNLGACYYQGRGVTQDYKKSVKWITKSAEQGDEQSKKMLKILQKKPKIFSKIINRLKPSADIDGTTFVQFGIVGLASYHFNLKKDSFINYENRPKEWKYDDGSALSDKVYFRDEKYDPKLKEFSAYVVFEKPLFGVRLVEYKLKFDDLLRKIVSGGIQTYDSCGNPIKVKSLLVTFGDDPNKDLVYKRYDYSPTNPQQNP